MNNIHEKLSNKFDFLVNLGHLYNDKEKIRTIGINTYVIVDDDVYYNGIEKEVQFAYKYGFITKLIDIKNCKAYLKVNELTTTQEHINMVNKAVHKLVYNK